MVSKTDPDFHEMAMRSQLYRQEIARECGFSKLALLHNPRVKDALRLLEEQLRSRKVLTPPGRVEFGRCSQTNNKQLWAGHHSVAPQQALGPYLALHRRDTGRTTSDSGE